jgi:hypothetical protein
VRLVYGPLVYLEPSPRIVPPSGRN